MSERVSTTTRLADALRAVLHFVELKGVRACCGQGVQNHPEEPPECCGQPDDLFDVVTSALAAHDAAQPGGEVGDGCSAAEYAECDKLRERLADLLTRTVNVLRGEPKPLHVHTWHNVPELAAALVAENKRLVAASQLRNGGHSYWGAGEPDCPKEIKAGNGELHTLMCKLCGQTNPRGLCAGYTPAPASQPAESDKRPCMYPRGLTTCGYPEDECMHEGSAEKAPPAGRHKYQPAGETTTIKDGTAHPAQATIKDGAAQAVAGDVKWNAYTALRWIADRYSDRKPMSECASDAYEMACVARAAIAVDGDAVLELCNAADDVGVNHFDTDDMPADVERLQQATLTVRTAIRASRGEGL